MIRILLLSIYHDPEPIPKTGELARALQQRGHQVTVVTAFPHYPSGELYDGYRLAPWRWELRNGVRVLRTYIYPYHGHRSVLRMVNYLSWMLSSIQAAWLTPRCDVIYVWHPPLTVGVSAWIISKLKRAPFVYDVQDLWPESALASGLMRPGRLVDLLYALARWVYRRAPRLLVVSDEAAAHVRDMGAAPSKITVAPHWIDLADFDRQPTRNVREEFGWGSKFVVMFAGNLGLVQGLETVIESAALLSTTAPNVQVVLVGDGVDRARLESLVAQHRLANVAFAGRHPASDMPGFFAAADALLVHLRKSDIADHAIPTKILAYMAAGRPVLCGTGGASANLVRAARCGIVTPPGDAAAMADGIRQLAAADPAERARLGTNARAYLSEHFDKQRIIDRYEKILLDLAGARGSAPLPSHTSA